MAPLVNFDPAPDEPQVCADCGSPLEFVRHSMSPRKLGQKPLPDAWECPKCGTGGGA